MGVFDSLRISASGLRAGRTRMDVIAQNIANVETTRSPGGGPYRRRTVVLATQQPGGSTFAGAAACAGVRVAAVADDNSPLVRVHNPGHPDADVDGYVLMPNVDLPTEMADMILAARAYEANAAALRAGREIIRHALSILA